MKKTNIILAKTTKIPYQIYLKLNTDRGRIDKRLYAYDKMKDTKSS